MTDLAAPPTSLDVLTGRLPVAANDLSGLTGLWHLWPDWSQLRPALARHLDGTPGDPRARYVAVVPYLFTDAIIVGTYGTVHGWFDNRWCYQRGAALPAAHVWDGAGEPAGWHRHPATGRRRSDGDPTREYIDP